jgi:hypothetical protein
MELKILKDKQQSTKQFVDHVLEHCKRVQGTILQNDTSTQIEEKLVSIGIATLFMWLVGLFISLTGIGILLFIIGLVLSKVINSKVYGKTRSEGDLKNEEKQLIELMDSYTKQLKGLKMKVGLVSKRNQVLFSEYPQRKAELVDLTHKIKSLDIKHLSVKYRAVYSKNIKSHDTLITYLNHAYQI